MKASIGVRTQAPAAGGTGGRDDLLKGPILSARADELGFFVGLVRLARENAAGGPAPSRRAIFRSNPHDCDLVYCRYASGSKLDARNVPAQRGAAGLGMVVAGGAGPSARAFPYIFAIRIPTRCCVPNRTGSRRIRGRERSG